MKYALKMKKARCSGKEKQMMMVNVRLENPMCRTPLSWILDPAQDIRQGRKDRKRQKSELARRQSGGVNDQLSKWLLS